MFQKIGIFAFVATGLFLIGKGIIEWQKQGEVQVTVDQFTEALIAGNRDLFLSTLDDELKKHFLINENKENKLLPLPNSVYRVLYVKVNKNNSTASAQVLIEGEGFVLKPAMTLIKNQESVWRISEMDPKTVKENWTDINKEIENLSDDKRAELEKQLKKKVKKESSQKTE